MLLTCGVSIAGEADSSGIPPSPDPNASIEQGKGKVDEVKASDVTVSA